jgi:hypothetical protein
LILDFLSDYQTAYNQTQKINNQINQYPKKSLIVTLVREMTDESPGREMTDEVLDETIWEVTRTWEEQWDSLKVNESKEVQQELDDISQDKRRLLYFQQNKKRREPRGTQCHTRTIIISEHKNL